MNDLPHFHRREISSTIRLIERSVNEILLILSEQIQISTTDFKKDILAEKRKKLTKQLEDLKELIARFVQKFNLEKEVIAESQILNSKKTVWEIQLREITAEVLNRKYGSSILIEAYREWIKTLIEKVVSL
ncbi:MAG: hypothetical protein ACP5P3_01205 [Ignavibacteria bacterium]